MVAGKPETDFFICDDERIESFLNGYLITKCNRIVINPEMHVDEPLWPGSFPKFKAELVVMIGN